jgi:hypothetical protein
MIQTEVIDELADLAGVGEQGESVQNRPWRSDFFKESFKQHGFVRRFKRRGAANSC